MTEIDNWTFQECEALSSITIPESVTKISSYAFYQCKALTNITIPNSVTEIDNSAFQECEALSSITLPESVEKIGYWVFCDCENLKEIVLRHTDPSQIDVSDAGNLGAKQATLYVPKEGVAAFQKDPFWSKCAAIKPITDEMLK